MGYEQHQHDFTGIVLGIQLLLGLSQPSVLFSKQTELLWLSGQVLLHQLLCAGFQAASTASSTKLLQSLWKFSILFSSEWKMLCLPGEELLPELFAAACWWAATADAPTASSATTVALIEPRCEQTITLSKTRAPRNVSVFDHYGVLGGATNVTPFLGMCRCRMPTLFMHLFPRSVGLRTI